MPHPIPHIIHNNTFWVCHERCLWWEEKNSIIIADLHLGKTGHFRKEGIAIPQSIYKADLQRLLAQVYFFKAERLIIVGDFTHSTANSELSHFLKWRKDFSMLHIDLVRGNHDILKDHWYKEAEIQLHEYEMLESGFLFRHEDVRVKPKEQEEPLYTFSGHLHPGITMKGTGRQSLRLPCFYFAARHCVLPAFSKFTGTYKVKRKKFETVYALTENELIRLD